MLTVTCEKHIYNFNYFFYILWKRSRLKSTFLPYHVKKHHSTLEMDTFKIMLLRSITNLAHDFKSSFLDIEITIPDHDSERNAVYV